MLLRQAVLWVFVLSVLFPSLLLAPVRMPKEDMRREDIEMKRAWEERWFAREQRIQAHCDKIERLLSEGKLGYQQLPLRPMSAKHPGETVPPAASCISGDILGCAASPEGR